MVQARVSEKTNKVSFLVGVHVQTRSMEIAQDPGSLPIDGGHRTEISFSSASVWAELALEEEDVKATHATSWHQSSPGQPPAPLATGGGSGRQSNTQPANAVFI